MRWEAQLQQWRGVTGTDRAKVAATVQPFFGLSAPEQQKALQAMNPSDRREMEATMEAFNRLPKEERDKWESMATAMDTAQAEARKREEAK